MKHLLIILTLVLSVTVLSAQEMSKKEKKAAREAEKIEKTKELIKAEAWQFEAIQMIPMQGKSKSLTTPYSVTLKNEEVDSYLPYYGRAYRVDYGTTDSPMTFKTDIYDYSIEKWKRDGWMIKFSAKNKSDILNYTFKISENGSTSLNVNSLNRQNISYYGDIVEVPEKEEK